MPAEPWGRFRWRLWIDVALGARSFGNMIAGVQVVSRKVPADSPISAVSEHSARGKDYWDMGGLTNRAPPTRMEDLAKADASWIFDATGLI